MKCNCRIYWRWWLSSFSFSIGSCKKKMSQCSTINMRLDMNMRQSGLEEEQNRPVQRGRSNSSVDTSLQVWQNTKTGKQQKLKWNHFLLFRGRLGPMCCDIHHLSPNAGETRTKMKKKRRKCEPQALKKWNWSVPWHGGRGYCFQQVQDGKSFAGPGAVLKFLHPPVHRL